MGHKGLMPRDKIPYDMHHLLVQLVKKAQEDGHITKDEAEVINQIQIDVRDLEKEIVTIKQENPQLESSKWVKEAMGRIIENSIRTAMADGIVSKDEEALINLLKSQIEKLE